MYSFSQFGGVALPIYNTVIDQSGGVVDSTLIQTVNGWYDMRGSKRAFANPATFRVRGVYASSDYPETNVYWARGNGDRLIASTGNPFVLTMRGSGEIRETLDKLRALIGTLGTLNRVPLAGNPSAAQSNSARLLSVKSTTSRELGVGAIEIEAVFECQNPYWLGAAQSVSGLYLVAVVGGNAPVRNAVLTITGTTASTSVVGAGSSFTFAGSGQTLVVTGNQATADGAATSVTIGTAHGVDTLVELSPGTNSIRVSGASTATLSWNDAWQ